MQPYPRSPDLVWPSQLHGRGCLSARAVDTGFPTVVRRLCLGPGCGWVWVSLTPPALAGVLGGCVWARFVVLSLFCRLFVVYVVWLRFRPAYGTCVVACALRLPPAVSGSGVPCGRACWGLGFGCAPPLLGGLLRCVCGTCARPAWSPAPPGWGCCAGVRVCARPPLVPRLSWLGCGVWACLLGSGLGCAPPFLVWLSGCVFCAFLFFFGCVFVWLCGVGCWLSLFRALWSLSPHPLSFGLGCWLFFFQRGVCLHVSVSLFLVGRCSWLGVAGFGWVLPLCLFGGPVFGAFWMGGLVASGGVGGRFGGCGLFSRPPPSPPCFFLDGGACVFLPLPSLGWRTHWPAFSVVFRAAVGGCVLLGRVPAPWAGLVMYTLGSAPLTAGLGPGSAGWAAAPGGCVWLWVRGWGCPCPFSAAVPVLTFWVVRHR